jgi:capsular polysaccharide biosynthesis protein
MPGAFAEAEAVLKPHGAGLANLCAKATVIELQRKDEFRACYFAQANAQASSTGTSSASRARCRRVSRILT